jgi:hypothetical protein
MAHPFIRLGALDAIAVTLPPGCPERASTLALAIDAPHLPGASR